MDDEAFVSGEKALKNHAFKGGFDFLLLKNCKTIRLDRVEHILLVHAMYMQPVSETCPRCNGSWKPDLKGKWLPPFVDIPWGSTPVIVKLMVLRDVCIRCKKRATLDISWLHRRRQMTYRLEKYIHSRAATMSTFAQISLDTCLDEKTVAAVFNRAFRDDEVKRGKNLPRVLGIDEVYFNGKTYTILIDVGSGKAVDLLKGRRMDVVRARLEAAENRKEVEYVLQDFYTGFRSAAKKSPEQFQKYIKRASGLSSRSKRSKENEFQLYMFPKPLEDRAEESVEEEKAIRKSRQTIKQALPNAKVIGDHFHLKQAIEEGFDQMRIHVQHEMSGYCKKMLRKSYTKAELELKGKTWFDDEVAKEVKQRVEELQNNDYLLNAHSGKLNGDQFSLVKKILDDYALLARGWQLKNAGLDIFPVKPPLGRSTKSRAAALAKRAELLMTEKEAAQRLDNWVTLVQNDNELSPFFKSPLGMIKRWREEIIRIGTTGYTNAGTEAKNRFLRVLVALSRGLKYKMLRQRLLWADEYRCIDRWPSFCNGLEETVTTKQFVKLAEAFLSKSESPMEPMP